MNKRGNYEKGTRDAVTRDSVTKHSWVIAVLTHNRSVYYGRYQLLGITIRMDDLSGNNCKTVK